MAEIYHSPSIYISSREHFLKALNRGVDITRSFTSDDVYFLDPFIEASEFTIISLNELLLINCH